MYPLLSSIYFIFTACTTWPPSFIDLDFKYETLFPDNLRLSAPTALFASLPLSQSGSLFSPAFCWISRNPLFPLSQIIYIRFVLCRLRSHADEGLRSLQGLGALTVLFSEKSICYTSPFGLHFFLKPLLKCVCLTSTTRFWQEETRVWLHFFLVLSNGLQLNATC